MRILVGDLAQIYGLSNQTLHYYEKRGILVPRRDVSNGYRYYELEDLRRLGTLKKYRNAEFSIQESIHLCEEATEMDVVSAYQKHTDFLWDEITRFQRIMRQIDTDLTLFARFHHQGAGIALEELKGFLRFESPGVQIVLQNKNMRQEATPWFENIFHTKASEMFSFSEDTGEVVRYSYGMLAAKEASHCLGLHTSPNVSEIQKGLFLTTFYRKQVVDFHEVAQMYAEMQTYMQEHQLQSRGKLFNQAVLVSTENGKSVALRQFLLPVRMCTSTE